MSAALCSLAGSTEAPNLSEPQSQSTSTQLLPPGETGVLKKRAPIKSLASRFLVSGGHTHKREDKQRNSTNASMHNGDKTKKKNKQNCKESSVA